MFRHYSFPRGRAAYGNYVLPRSRFSVSRESEDLVGRGSCVGCVGKSTNYHKLTTSKHDAYCTPFALCRTRPQQPSRSLLDNNATIEQQCNSRSLLKSTTMLIRCYQQLALSTLPFSCFFTNISTLNSAF